MKIFAERMKQYMEEKEWNQQQFADLLGVTRQDINGWILGKHTPHINRLEGFAEKMGVSVNWLLGKSESKTNGLNGYSGRRRYLMDRIAKADDKKLDKFQKLMELIDDEENGHHE